MTKYGRKCNNILIGGQLNNKLKKLVFAVAMGLAITVQSVMPVISVKAAEAVPMALVTCDECGTPVNVDIVETEIAKAWLHKCDVPSHKEEGKIDCNVYCITVVAYSEYLCPKCGASELISTSTEDKEVHVF